MNKPLIYITHASPHHAAHSGYTQLLKHIQHETIEGKESSMPYRIRKRIASVVSNDIQLYDSKSVSKEYQLVKLMLKQKNGIAHFLNGERDIWFSPSFKRFNNWQTVASFHEPPEIITKQLKTTRHIKKLDGAIAVGLSQLDYLQSTIGGNAIEYIPHGIDTHFFTPSATPPPSIYAVWVGVHYRAFEIIEPFVNIMAQKHPEFKLKIVIGQAYTQHLPVHKNIEVYSEINDDDLRTLYRDASFLFLPLQEVTACNAILEALACGTPVITTDLESNHGYLNDTCSFLIKNNNIDDFISVASLMIEDDSKNNIMRIAARKQSMMFTWETVTKQLLNYYKQHFQY